LRHIPRVSSRTPVEERKQFPSEEFGQADDAN
jgi:hypothetical protein